MKTRVGFIAHASMLGVAFLGIGLASVTGRAESPESILQVYEAQAKKDDPAFKGFSADRGKVLYYLEGTNSQGQKVRCATCHTVDPRGPGKTRAGKVIEPLAPSANPNRFTDTAKVEKWFRRNCHDVLQRECTNREKGDFIAYLRSIR